MGYLVCEKCGGYYELRRGESPEDFDNCQCGGKLKYVDDLEDYPYNNKTSTDNSRFHESYTSVVDVEGLSDSIINNHEMDVLYTETIALRWLLIFFMFILIFFVALLLYQSLVIPNEVNPLINIILAIVVISILFSANFIILRTKITQKYLSISCGLFKHIIRWEDITSCRLDNSIEFNGYGIRYGSINGERVQGYVMGNSKVLISLNKGKYRNFVFTTRNPEEIIMLIRKQIGLVYD
jgi:hypothetical protein